VHRHPRLLRQFAGHALSAQRHEQVHHAGVHAGAGGGDGNSAPAKIINRAPKIGTLQIGAPGDVAIMELVEGQTSFVDTRNNKREGKLC
jgi:hypothetical protein